MNERFYKLFYEKNAFQRYFARKFLFNFFQKFGLHITGNHFYELIPDTRSVSTQYSDAPRDLVGIDWRLSECEQTAVRLLTTYGAEYKTKRHLFGFTEPNYYFRGFDPLMLYVFLRDLKPAKMIEIGQGSSTQIALAALQENAQETGAKCELVSIDPYARFSEKQAPQGVTLRILTKELQSVEMKPLLENCNFLFVDSSHVYKFGSDVEYQFTKIYPFLAPGTFVHIHDIFSPYDYPLFWMAKLKQFWNEQYFLENFLMFNDTFKITLPLYLLSQQSNPFLEAARSLSLEQTFQFEGYSCYLQRK